MKRLLLWLLLASPLLGLHGQTPDAEFLRIYSLMQEGEALERSGQLGQAMDRYQEAHRELERFGRANPSWNRKIVNFRMGYLAAKVADLKENTPAPAQVQEPARRPTVPVAPARSGGVPLPVPRGDFDEVTALRAWASKAEARATAAEERAERALRTADQAVARANELEDRNARIALDLRKALERVEVLEAGQINLERTRDELEAQRATLQAKLREALSPRPAAIDPAELIKAEERNRLLVKENEILNACLDRAMAEHQRVLDSAKRALEFEQQLQAARGELAAARREADELREASQRLHVQLEQSIREREEESALLKKEIAALRKDLASARAEAEAAGKKEQSVAALQYELSEQRKITEALQRENAGLMRQLEWLTSIRVTPASLKIPELGSDTFAGAEAARARRLERERDELRRELAQARNALRQQDPEGANPKALAGRVRHLEARLGVLEAQREPYTREELALFREPAERSTPRVIFVAQRTGKPAEPSTPSRPSAPPTPPAEQAPSPAPADQGTNAPLTRAAPGAEGGPAGSESRRRTAKDLPPGAGVLASQAERAFMMRRYDEAERYYREILTLDENNVFTLGNLAAILVEQGKLDAAEEVAGRALKADPEDPFCLSLLGIIRFRQERYDDAFDALSRSAQLDPDNADTQNYLGITLSHRGDRKAAEAALRRALKLNPSSAAAHYNLAIVYATQKPPFLELARYHYEKARLAGQPRNPAFEEVLEGKSAAQE
jgi:tetratricopeptide (TPR) repeat protein